MGGGGGGVFLVFSGRRVSCFVDAGVGRRGGGSGVGAGAGAGRFVFFTLSLLSFFFPSCFFRVVMKEKTASSCFVCLSCVALLLGNGSLWC